MSARAFLPAICYLLPAAAYAQDNLAVRQEQIHKLSPGEQQQLLRSQERFNELPVDKQDQLRKLHEELARDPNAEKLRGLLERYHAWLKTLSPELRAELVELAPDERIERIRQLMSRQRDEQERRRPRFAGSGPSLPPADQQAIFRWFGAIVWRNREQLLEGVSPQIREEIERLDETMQRRRLSFVALQQWKNGPPPVRPEDLQQLTQILSQETQARLAGADPQQKKRLVKEFLFQAMATRMEAFSTRRSLAMVSNEDLERFFQRKLPAHDRQRLMNLPRDQMREELRHLYIQHARSPDGPPMGPPRDRPGDRPLGPPDGSEFRPAPPGDRMDRPEFDRPEFPPRLRGPKRPPGEQGGKQRTRPPPE